MIDELHVHRSRAVLWQLVGICCVDLAREPDRTARVVVFPSPDERERQIQTEIADAERADEMARIADAALTDLDRDRE